MKIATKTKISRIDSVFHGLELLVHCALLVYFFAELRLIVGSLMLGGFLAFILYCAAHHILFGAPDWRPLFLVHLENYVKDLKRAAHDGESE